MSTFTELLGINADDPEFIAATKAAREQYERAEIRHCANGCTNYFDPQTQTIFAGFGKAGCELCD